MCLALFHLVIHNSEISAPPAPTGVTTVTPAASGFSIDGANVIAPSPAPVGYIITKYSYKGPNDASNTTVDGDIFIIGPTNVNGVPGAVFNVTIVGVILPTSCGGVNAYSTEYTFSACASKNIKLFSVKITYALTDIFLVQQQKKWQF